MATCSCIETAISFLLSARLRGPRHSFRLRLLTDCRGQRNRERKRQQAESEAVIVAIAYFRAAAQTGFKLKSEDGSGVCICEPWMPYFDSGFYDSE